MSAQINSDSERVLLLKSLNDLETCDQNLLEDFTVQILEKNGKHFRSFGVDLASRVLALKKIIHIQGLNHQKIDKKVEQLFHLSQEPNRKPSSQAEALEHIATACLTRNFVLTAQDFEECDINEEAVRLKIAQICVEKSTLATILKFEDFDIQSEEGRLQIARISAEKDPESTMEYLQNFNLIESHRIEIIAICAKKTANSVFRHFQNGDIQSEQGRIKIAGLCTLYDPMGTIEHINIFNIKSEKGRFELAKMCAERKPKLTAEKFQQFGIFSEEFRIEIALICVIRAPECIDIIHNFDLQSVKVRIEFVQRLISIDPERNFAKIQNSQFLDPESFSLACIMALRNNLNVLKFIDKDLIDVLSTDNRMSDEVKSLIEKSIASIPAEKNFQIQQQLDRWVSGLILLLQTSRSRSLELLTRFLEPLAAMRDPSLRWQLTVILLDLDHEMEDLSTWQYLLENSKWNLLAIPLLHLKKQGVDGFDKLGNDLMFLTKKKSSVFHNKVNIRLLISTLVEIEKDPSFSIADKKNLIHRIFYQADHLLSDKAILHNLSSVNNTLRLGKSRLLLQEGELGSLFAQAFQEVFSLKDVQGDILEAFNRKFHNDFHLVSLMKYAASIKSLNDQTAMDCFTEYVSSIMNDTFLERRYSLKPNSHLSDIFKMRPDLLDKWRAPLRMELSASNAGDTKTPFDPEEWLIANISKANLSEERENEFHNFLVAPPLERKQIMAKFGKKSSILQKEVRQKSADDPSAKNLAENQILYKFLSICCKLADTDPVKLQDIKKQLNDLLVVIKDNTHYGEFQIALEELLNSFNQKKPETEGFYAEIIDDPFALLTCGTVIPDSCQSVDGHPTENCGLLAYLMDGKIKLGVVKDGFGNIVSRCMIKLLINDESAPVLLREKMYSKTFSFEHRNALNAIAKMQADIMGLDAVSEEVTDKPYTHSIQSLGSSAPYEYSDAGRNKLTNGKYKIQTTYNL